MERGRWTWREVALLGGLLVPLAAVGVARAQESRLYSNETMAIATLRNLASCQAQIQTSGKIDADRDGIGEYGTFLEMTGSVAVRRGLRAPKGRKGDPVFRTLGATFLKRSTPVNPPILSPALANVDAQGFVTKSGYAFLIFLPDTAMPAGFVHETGPISDVGLAGGDGAVGIDLAETTWCGYAQPVVAGESGNRRFFVNQSGDVLQSPNDVHRYQGVARPIAGNSAFTGDGITSRIAVGAVGRDGDVWKVTN